MKFSAANALAWRLHRHFLEEPSGSVAAVVGRLGAVPAWSGDPEFAIRRRLARPREAVIRSAVAAGEVVQAFAFRGAVHLMTPDHAGAVLAVRAAGRQWERRSWCQHYALAPSDWPALRQVVRSAVAHRPLSRAELVDAIADEPRFEHLRDGLADPGSALVKAFAWQGDVCLGLDADGRFTYQSLETVPAWNGLRDLEEAGHHVVRTYLSCYGPATTDNLEYWLVEGLSAGRRRLDRWLEELIEDASVARVEVDGRPMLHLAEQLDGLAAAESSGAVTLLPGYDQWVLGPGTKDQMIVPPELRADVTRGANVVLHGGVVVGTWKVVQQNLEVLLCAGAGNVPERDVGREAGRLDALRNLDVKFRVKGA